VKWFALVTIETRGVIRVYRGRVHFVHDLLRQRPLYRRNLKTEVFTIKTQQMFSVHTTLEEFKIKTQQSLAILDLFLRKTWSEKSHDYRDAIGKLRFQNLVRPHENEKAAFSNLSGLRSVFRKAPFSWRFSVHGRPNRRNQAAFSTFSGVAWTPYEIGFLLWKYKAKADWFQHKLPFPWKISKKLDGI